MIKGEKFAALIGKRTTNLRPNNITTSTKYRRPSKFSEINGGFTLIEIMVVVAIIGTMVLVIGVSISRDTDRLARLESQRFHAIVNEVRDEAIISGESYFLLLDEKSASYRFQAARSDRSSSNDEGLLRVRKLERGVALRWDVFELFEEEGSDADLEPRVLITPLGEITPFEAEFIGDEMTYDVFINNENQLAWRDKDTVLF